jgi:hypothetical protein
MPLYRGILHPRTRGLYFVAMAAGPGALLPVADAQARWAAAHIDGAIRIDDLDKRFRWEGRRLKRQFGRPHPVWRDRWGYIIELEREVRARASPARAW